MPLFVIYKIVASASPIKICAALAAFYTTGMTCAYGFCTGTPTAVKKAGAPGLAQII